MVYVDYAIDGNSGMCLTMTNRDSTVGGVLIGQPRNESSMATQSDDVMVCGVKRC